MGTYLIGYTDTLGNSHTEYVTTATAYLNRVEELESLGCSVDPG